MSLHPRKLLNDSPEDSITKFCEQYCDLIKNPLGSCPPPCISRCHTICNHALFDVPSPPPPAYVDDHPGRSRKLPLILTISLVVLATTFLVFLCYTVYKFYKGWYRSGRHQPPAQPQGEEARLDFLDEDHGPVVDHPIWYIRTVGLEPSVISAIAICKYKRGDGLVEGTECSVCLNEFQEDETLRLLPKCNHAFHIPCIDTWLRSHTNCPMCRAGIVINTASPHSPGQSSYNSGHVEETQLQVSENNRESGRDREDEELQRVTIELEAEDGSRARSALKRDEEDVARNSSAREGDGFQPLRRSVSVDSLSASMVSAAITNAFPVHSSDRISDKQVLQMNETSSCVAPKRVDAVQNSSKSAGSTSNERSLQKGSSSSMVMRSLSCSAKVFLSRYSRNSRSSVTLPRSF